VLSQGRAVCDGMLRVRRSGAPSRYAGTYSRRGDQPLSTGEMSRKRFKDHFTEIRARSAPVRVCLGLAGIKNMLNAKAVSGKVFIAIDSGGQVQLRPPAPMSPSARNRRAALKPCWAVDHSGKPGSFFSPPPRRSAGHRQRAITEFKYRYHDDKTGALFSLVYRTIPSRIAQR